MAVEVCPSHPVVPAGYVDWSKPRLVRRIAELEKVSGGPLRALPCPTLPMQEGQVPGSGQKEPCSRDITGAVCAQGQLRMG